MKLLPTKWRLLVVVACSLPLLAFLLWQWSPQQLHDVLKSNVPEVKGFPLFYMRDMKTTQYAADGSSAYLLETAQFNYYEGEGSTTEKRQANAYAMLEKPLITFYGEASSVWRLSATNGESRNNGELITLMGDVRLWQVQDGIDTTELTTQSLTVKPAQAFAQTFDPVVVKGMNGITVESIGLKLFIDSSRVEFLSAVKSSYDEP